MPSWLLYTIGVLIFAFGLLASIALHEIGHLLPAKKFGVKVTQYMVGFGPTVFSRTRGDTEYGVKAIPLGGYIRMIGMVPPRKDGSVSRWPRRMATVIEDFRKVSRAEIDPADEDRQFYRLTPGKKMIVMLGGPTMNLLIFLVLFTILVMTIGTVHQDETTVGGLSKCVVPANSAAARANTCPKGAAAPPSAGVLRTGDRIESINGVAVATWAQVTAQIRPAAGHRLTLVVRRAGQDVTLRVTPVANLNYVDDARTKLATVGFIGFAPSQRGHFETVPITGVPGQIGAQITLGVDALGRYPQKVASLFGTVFEGKKRDPQGAVGVVGIGRISGAYAESTLLTTKEKVATLLGLLASVNLLLFFFNLLPLLPLDGGHVAGALVESVKRGRARLRARGRPLQLAADGSPVAARQIFVDTAAMLPVMYGVASLLGVLTLLTLYADIVKPINPFGG